MIILDSLRVRPICDVLDGSKAQAVKISASFGDNPRSRELAWIKPDVFERVSGVNFNCNELETSGIKTANIAIS